SVVAVFTMRPMRASRSRTRRSAIAPSELSALPWMVVRTLGRMPEGRFEAPDVRGAIDVAGNRGRPAPGVCAERPATPTARDEITSRYRIRTIILTSSYRPGKLWD